MREAGKTEIRSKGEKVNKKVIRCSKKGEEGRGRESCVKGGWGKEGRKEEKRKRGKEEKGRREVG